MQFTETNLYSFVANAERVQVFLSPMINLLLVQQHSQYRLLQR